MRTLLIAATAALGLGISAPAFAQGSGNYCSQVHPEQRIPAETVQKNVQEMGYDVRRVRFDGGCYKVYHTEKTTGGDVEAYYNPANGELVRASLGARPRDQRRLARVGFENHRSRFR
jgi:hypothetical protein